MSREGSSEPSALRKADNGSVTSEKDDGIQGGSIVMFIARSQRLQQISYDIGRNYIFQESFLLPCCPFP